VDAASESPGDGGTADGGADGLGKSGHFFTTKVTKEHEGKKRYELRDICYE
jgi:hypothetical protein